MSQPEPAAPSTNAGSTPAIVDAPTETTASPVATTSQLPGAAPRKRKVAPEDLIPLEEVMFRRLHKIKEGDNVLLRLPSDQVKAVVAAKDGLIHLGKFGSFPAAQLLGLHYDITYEITADPSQPTPSGDPRGGAGAAGDAASGSKAFGQGQGKGKKNKKQKAQGNVNDAVPGQKTNPGWSYMLRPLKRQAVADLIIDDITETNEFIDDSEAVRQALLTQEEIVELRAQGATAEDIMQAQLKRHERFQLKTEFSKEKWRKRKERKYLQTIHPLSPSAYNIANHQFVRAPFSILSMREDTLSQLLTQANIRPGGRYIVVDDTGGLVTAAVLERMGATGRVMTFTDADSPPAWGVLNTMNFSPRELSCIKHLSWLQAEESYVPPALPNEDELPSIAATKTQARQRRHMFQVADLNATRDELHRGGWDGLILSTELNPLSVLARLARYVGGSGSVVVYSQHLQVLAETLRYCKLSPSYLNPNLTESWTRTYQVLPGRTHPTMSTSATGGYLLQATTVIPSKADTTGFSYERNRKHADAKKRKKEEAAAAGAGEAGPAAKKRPAVPVEGPVDDDGAEGSSDEAEGPDARRADTRDGTADEDVDMML